VLTRAPLAPAPAPAVHIKRSTGHKHTHIHTHTHRQRTTPPTPAYTHDKNNTPNPQKNTSHKHLTTLAARMGGGRDDDMRIPPVDPPSPKAPAGTAHSAHREHCHHTAPQRKGREVGLYTILPSPILYGIYCNYGGSAVTLYCAIVWAMTGRGGGCLNKGCMCKE